MATYQIKMLKDEENKPFVPLVSTDCIRDKNNQTLQQMLDKKLSPSNLLAGDYVSITTEGNNCYVNVDLPANLNIVNNLTTSSAGQGALDAYQGKILKDSIPQVINDLSSTSVTSALSANQGYVLNNKFSNYTTTTDMNNKFSNYTTTTDMNNRLSNYSLLSNTPQTQSGDTKISWLQLAYNNKWQLYLRGNTSGVDKDFYIDLLDSPSSNDTGWISVTTWQNGAENWDNGANPVQYRKIGNIVYFQGLMKCGSSGVQFTIPEGFRPNNKSYNCWICRCGTSTCRIHVNYSGILGNIAIEGNSSSGLEVPLSPVSYIAGA